MNLINVISHCVVESIIQKRLKKFKLQKIDIPQGFIQRHMNYIGSDVRGTMQDFPAIQKKKVAIFPEFCNVEFTNILIYSI